ncbi:S-layer homology domain-containing protein [Brevibacillus borstelensis]|uniref:S-layer homology domain-containing protein n=1 Tax=Brevibacillus borstelensis TaxID=45462 RepID=UPI0030BE0836
MLKRYLAWIVMFSLFIQCCFAAGASAAPGYYEDIQGHWAQKEIEELSALNIYRVKYGFFNPDSPIARGEALALLNRVLEGVYGPLGTAKRNTHLDHRYLLKQETEQLLANMRVMLDVQTGFVNSFDPGESMLFYLHLSERSGMKQPQLSNINWWLSADYMQKPLTREEASMILFHVLAPYKLRMTTLKLDEVSPYYTSYYLWKRETKYEDTASPYATAVAEFNLFNAESHFEPKKQMTRAQFAVILKRLHDYFKSDAPQQFKETQTRQKNIINLFLTSANQAYVQNDQSRIQQFFGKDAQDSLQEIAPLPLHDYSGSLAVRKDDSNPKRLWATGSYHHQLTGNYQVEYTLEQDESSLYGWKVVRMDYKQK